MKHLEVSEWFLGTKKRLLKEQCKKCKIQDFQKFAVSIDIRLLSVKKVKDPPMLILYFKVNFLIINETLALQQFCHRI